MILENLLLQGIKAGISKGLKTAFTPAKTSLPSVSSTVKQAASKVTDFGKSMKLPEVKKEPEKKDAVFTVQEKIKRKEKLTPADVQVIQLNASSFPNTTIETPETTAKRKLAKLDLNFTDAEKKAIKEKKLESPLKKPGIFSMDFGAAGVKPTVTQTFSADTLLQFRKNYQTVRAEAISFLKGAEANGVDPQSGLTVPQAEERIRMIDNIAKQAQEVYKKLTPAQKYSAELASISQDVEHHPLLDNVPLAGEAAKYLLKSGSRSLSQLISPKGFEEQTGEKGSRLQGLEEGLNYAYSFIPEVTAGRAVSKEATKQIDKLKPSSETGQTVKDITMSVAQLPEIVANLRANSKALGALGVTVKAASPKLYEKALSLADDMERGIFQNSKIYTPAEKAYAGFVKDYLKGTANFTVAQRVMSGGQMDLKEAFKTAALFELGMRVGNRLFGGSLLAQFPTQFSTFAAMHAIDHPNSSAKEIFEAGVHGLAFALLPGMKSKEGIKQLGNEINAVKDIAKVGINQFAFGREAAARYVENIQKTLGTELNGAQKGQLIAEVMENAQSILTKLGALSKNTGGYVQLPGGKKLTPEEAAKLSNEDIKSLGLTRQQLLEVVAMRAEARKAQETGSTVTRKTAPELKKELNAADAEVKEVTKELDAAYAAKDLNKIQELETKLEDVTSRRDEVATELRAMGAPLTSKKVKEPTVKELEKVEEKMEAPEKSLESELDPMVAIQKEVAKRKKQELAALKTAEPSLGKLAIERKKKASDELQSALGEEEARIDKTYRMNESLNVENPYIIAERTLREAGIEPGKQPQSVFRKLANAPGQAWDKVVDKAYDAIAKRIPTPVKRIILGNRAATPEEYRKMAIGRDVLIQNAADYFFKVGQMINKGTTPTERVAMGKAVRGEIPWESLPENLAEKVKYMREILDHNGAQAVRYGLLSADTYEANKGSYLARMYEIYENPIIKKFFATTPNPSKLNLKNFMQRQDIPADIRALMQEMIEPAYAFAKGGFNVKRDVIIADFFENIAKNPEWVRDKEAPDFIQLSSDKKWGALKDKFVQKDIYRDLLEVSEFKGQIDAAVNDFQTSNNKFNAWFNNPFKKGVSMWKKMKVVYNPATHARNLMSNSFLLDMSGMPWSIQSVYLPMAAYNLAKNTHWAKAARQSGAIGSEYNANDFANLYDKFKSLKNPADMIRNAGSKVDDFVTGMYQAEEAVFKLAKFMHEVKVKNKSVEQAATEAKKWLFDYSDVPTWVKYVGTYYQPFVTFKYKVLPRIVETAYRNPLKFVKYALMATAWEAMAQTSLGENEEQNVERLRNRPAWMQGESFGDTDNFISKLNPANYIISALGDRVGVPNYLTIPIKNNLGELYYFDLSYILPWNIDEASRNPEEVGFEQNFKPQLPFVMPVIEVMNNLNFFSKQPIFEKNDPVRVKYQKTLNHFYKYLAPSFAPGIFPSVTGIKGGYSWDKLKSAMSDKPYANPLGAGLQGRVMSPEIAILDTLLGIKLVPVDETGTKFFNAKAVEDDIADLKNDARTIIKQRAAGIITMEEAIEKARILDERMQAVSDKAERTLGKPILTNGQFERAIEGGQNP